MPNQLVIAGSGVEEEGPKGSNIEQLRGAFVFQFAPGATEGTFSKVILVASCVRHGDCGAQWKLCLGPDGDIRKGDRKALEQHANRMERVR